MQANDATQARKVGTVGATGKAKAKTGTEMVSHKNDSARTDRMIVAR